MSNTKWNTWDCETQLAFNDYNHHLSGTSGYMLPAHAYGKLRAPKRLPPTLIAQRYNGGDNANYAKKLDYALSLVRQGKVGCLRTLDLIGFALVLGIPAMALADSIAPERALREECSAFPQAEMRGCLSKKAENSEKALRQAEKNVADTLSRWHEDSRYISQAKAKFARSNKEFAKYRQSQCQFAASLIGGGAGNAHQMNRLACAAELNNRRAEQLGDAISDIPLK